MKTSLLTLLAVICATLPRAAAAQTSAGGLEHFSNEELSFDRPVGWDVEDRSDERVLRVRLTRAGGPAFVEVAMLRDSGATPEQKRADEEKFLGASILEMVRRLGVSAYPSGRDYRCPLFGERPGWGVRLSGRFEGRPAKGELYAMAAADLYLNVSFFHTEREEKAATAAWKTFLETLKFEREERLGKNRVIGAVFKGRALSKPQPAYPSTAKAAGVTGAVAVNILVDEKGNVIEAKATSGDPALHAASEDAARKAKFSPTLLCGRPVKVTGVITYNFILQ